MREFMPFYGSSGFGISNLSYEEIAAWARLTRRSPTAPEVLLLKRLDETFRRITVKPPSGKGTKAEPDIEATNAEAVKDMTSGLGKKRTIVRSKKNS